MLTYAGERLSSNNLAKSTRDSVRSRAGIHLLVQTFFIFFYLYKNLAQSARHSGRPRAGIDSLVQQYEYLLYWYKSTNTAAAFALARLYRNAHNTMGGLEQVLTSC